MQHFRHATTLLLLILGFAFTPTTDMAAQDDVRIPQWKTTLKVGGSDIFNNRYIQHAAGPTLGGLYYIAFTFDNGIIQ